MVQRVNLPNGQIGNFPDDMSREQIEAVLTAQFPPGTPVVSQADPGPAPAQAPQDAGEPGFLSGLADDALGILETGAQFATGAVAEPVAGLMGAVKTLTSGPEAGQETIEGFREALTFQPRSESGKAKSAAVGAFFEPVGKLLQKAEEFSGDLAADIGRKTGSPTLEAFAGAFGATLPTAALEILGFKGAGKLAKRKGLKERKQRTTEQFKAMEEAGASVQELKQVSRGVYREIDDLGATINPAAYNKMMDEMQRDMKKAGFRPRIDDKVAVALEELNGFRGQAMSVADVNDLRTVAKGFVDSIDPKTKALGLTITDNLDKMLDSKSALNLPKGTSRTVAESYRVAREFWGQAKRSETIERLLKLAEDNRAGFLNGVQTEFQKLIRDHTKKKGDGKYFSEEDINLMREVTSKQESRNILKNISKLRMTNAGGGSLIPLGGPVAGVPLLAAGQILPGSLAVMMPIFGEMSSALAIKMAKKDFKMADAVIRAGARGREITRAYFENIPKKDRSPGELAEMLKDPDIDISKLPKTKFTDEALAIVTRERELRTVAATQAPIALAQNAGDE